MCAHVHAHKHTHTHYKASIGVIMEFNVAAGIFHPFAMMHLMETLGINTMLKDPLDSIVQIYFFFNQVKFCCSNIIIFNQHSL